MVGYIRQAVIDGSCIEPACEEADISLRTYRRWAKGGNIVSDKRPDAIRKKPANKLSEEERDAIVEVVNQPEYASLPPSQIVPKLADKRIYMASESSFYRVLHERSQVQHRGKTQQHKKHPAPSSYTATGPNQVWSWDITYCSSNVRGKYYYLYLIEDISVERLSAGKSMKVKVVSKQLIFCNARYCVNNVLSSHWFCILTMVLR